jgi:hypothetical protein
MVGAARREKSIEQGITVRAGRHRLQSAFEAIVETGVMKSRHGCAAHSLGYMEIGSGLMNGSGHSRQGFKQSVSQRKTVPTS